VVELVLVAVFVVVVVVLLEGFVVVVVLLNVVFVVVVVLLLDVVVVFRPRFATVLDGPAVAVTVTTGRG
jgi:hypothetical protein